MRLTGGRPLDEADAIEKWPKKVQGCMCACFTQIFIPTNFSRNSASSSSSFVPGSVNPLEAGLSCPNFFNPPSIFSRIVNGQEAVKGNWPWFAWFGGCGGTILTKKTDGSDDLIMTGKGGMNSRESLSPQFPFSSLSIPFFESLWASWI